MCKEKVAVKKDWFVDSKRKPFEKGFYESVEGYYGFKGKTLYFTGEYDNDGYPLFDAEGQIQWFYDYQVKMLSRVETEKMETHMKRMKKEANWIEEKLKEID